MAYSNHGWASYDDCASVDARNLFTASFDMESTPSAGDNERSAVSIYSGS